MTTRKSSQTVVCGQVVQLSSAGYQATVASDIDSDSKSDFEMRSQFATPQDLLGAWDCDLWRMSHSPLKPGLKPLTAEELEALVARFPDVMPHIYVRPEAVLFETAASEGNLMEVLRHELVSPGEAQIHLYTRGGVDTSEWCGSVSGTADVLAFNPLTVRVLHQTLAPSIRLVLE